MARGAYLIAGLLAVASATPATALADRTEEGDRLLIDSMGSEAAVPDRGARMERVESTFGAPRERRDSVGDPPITRWDYDGFSVYFEHERVIHSVVHR